MARTAGRPGKPRVALVAWEVSERQGAGRAISEIVRRTRGEFEFVVVSRRVSRDLLPYVSWRRVHAPDSPYRLKLLVFLLTGGIELARARADVRHVHASGPTVLNRVDLTTVRFLRAAFAATDGGHQDRSLAMRLQLAAERLCLRRSRRLSSISAGAAGELRRVSRRPVLLLPNGVDATAFRPDLAARRGLREELGVAETAVVALFVGHSWGRKGLGLAIEGLSVGEETGTAPNELWVVGSGAAAEYEALAARHGLRARLRFFGLQKDVRAYYQAADLLVLPTAYETFCQVAYEAAATGLPVVATRVNGIEELIGDGLAGVAVERDAQDVGRAIALLAGDAELRRRLGDEGRRRALARTWETAAEEVAKAYREIIAERRHGRR